jgi:hypothetical protein
MEKINTVVAVYNTPSQAEDAITAFKRSDFDMRKLPAGPWRDTLTAAVDWPPL